MSEQPSEPSRPYVGAICQLAAITDLLSQLLHLLLQQNQAAHLWGKSVVTVVVLQRPVAEASAAGEA